MKDVMKNTIPQKIQELVNKFTEHYDQYKQPDYNETQTRREFIDPFFKELGWDVDNSNAKNSIDKEVIHEDRVKIDGNTKSPDYSFRIGGKRKFFVEAKKPSVDLKNHKESIFQLRRYGWTAGLILCVLTDFEEFCVYQTNNITPNKDDNPSKGRIFYCQYDELANKCTQYPEFSTNWDFIVGTFTKQAIVNGSFDKFVDKKKKSQDTFDTVFLRSIQEWRVKIAENIVLRNKITVFGENSIDLLKEQQLNSVVVKTIDRLIFLRICEDRGIERFAQLLDISHKKAIYKELLILFNKANDIYNAGLFEEKNKEGIGDVSRLINIDNDILQNIIQELYDTYSFEFVPLDILGQIYENFLGDTITFENETPKIDAKPEVKKAGGVYYTPEYIIDYIVENTIGEALKTRTLKTIQPFRICDPACGSGAFLIVAYEYIMKWYIEQYSKEKNSKYIYQNDKGGIALALNERKRILKDHIFGVDIDKQAVEVAKLSLLLKCLEGVDKENIENHNRLFSEKALPNIDDNIKCGNSLIGTDYGSGKLFDLEESIKVNAFDWKSEFKQIFKDNGFDCVVGNPPYETTRSDGIFKDVKEYLANNYKTAEDKFDLYTFFIEKGSKICKEYGFISYITPSTFLTKPLSIKIRKFILQNHCVANCIEFKYNVFKASVPTCIFIINKNNKILDNQIKICPNVKNIDSFKELKHKILLQKSLIVEPNYYMNIFADEMYFWILKKCNVEQSMLLGELCEIYNGIQTGDDKKYTSHIQSNKEWQPVIIGSDIQRYIKKWSGKYVHYLPKELHSNTRLNIFKTEEKIIIRQTANRIIATFDNEEYFTMASSFVIKQFEKSIDYLYLLSILNSNLFYYLYINLNNEQGRVFPQIKKKHIFNLPIPLATPQQQTHLATLAQQMLDMNKRMGDVKVSEIEKTHLRRQIEATDKLIDKAVYELYGLTQEEICVVEGKN